MWETKAILSRTAVSDNWQDSKNYCTTGLVKSFVSGLKSRCFPMMTAPKTRSKYHWQKNLKMSITGDPSTYSPWWWRDIYTCPSILPSIRPLPAPWIPFVLYSAHEALQWIIILCMYVCMYVFGCASSQLRHVGSSSLTRNWTQAPCIGRVES